MCYTDFAPERAETAVAVLAAQNRAAKHPPALQQGSITMSELKKADSTQQEQITEAWATRWGLLLRMARQVAGLSLSELAERSGLSKGYLSKLESAHPSAANPSRATLAALARALPSTIPLIQNLDPDAGLPAPRTLLRRDQQRSASLPLNQPEDAELAYPGFNTALAQNGTQALPASWAEWEILLALMMFERSGLGSPTLPVLARACGAETLNSGALLHLENAGLLRPIPPTRQGEATRYTQGPTKLDELGIQRPADLLMRAAISLFLKPGKSDHE